ncbi:MAG TPA: hypothetical protein VK425_00745, partial [Acidimicrobiales bacterium]|nr:hypothetical protein [Acidimicrobiales bacterium]
VALARVLLRPRPLYLLDEPTVHLDEATEAGVLASLGTALAGSSALIVSHRPALRRLADRVVRIEDGQLLELGGDRRAGEGAEVGAALGGASPEAAVAGARP